MTQVAAAMLLGVEVSANAALVHAMTVSAVAHATVSRSGGAPRMWQVINMVAPHSAVTSPAHGTAESWLDAMGNGTMKLSAPRHAQMTLVKHRMLSAAKAPVESPSGESLNKDAVERMRVSTTSVKSATTKNFAPSGMMPVSGDKAQHMMRMMPTRVLNVVSPVC